MKFGTEAHLPLGCWISQGFDVVKGILASHKKHFKSLTNQMFLRAQDIFIDDLVARNVRNFYWYCSSYVSIILALSLLWFMLSVPLLYLDCLRLYNFEYCLCLYYGVYCLRLIVIFPCNISLSLVYSLQHVWGMPETSTGNVKDYPCLQAMYRTPCLSTATFFHIVHHTFTELTSSIQKLTECQHDQRYLVKTHMKIPR